MTLADLARCREILDAWDKGAARQEDLDELRKLLPGVLEAAEPLTERLVLKVGVNDARQRPCPRCLSSADKPCKFVSGRHKGDTSFLVHEERFGAPR